MNDNPMTIAFLRAINVGGHVIKMESLRGLFESFGMQNVVTFLASGNVIFNAPQGSDKEDLERVIEKGLQEALGYRVATFLRSPDALKKAAAYEAFPADVMEKAIAYNVGFLREEPGEISRNRLLRLETDIDRLHLMGREVYWACQLKQSDSSLSNAAFEKALGMECTLRGINTVRKLEALISKRGTV